MTVIPSQLDIQVASLRNELSDLHTCMPAEIVAVREGKDKRQFVDVLPHLQRSVINEEGEPVDEAFPVIPMVPVGYPQGGGFFISLPLRVGDIVLVVFAERSLDNWIESGAPAKQTPIKPGDLSMHSLEGAIALPCGPAPRSALLTGVDAADLVIGTASGTVLQRWKADGNVEIGPLDEDATDFVALAGKVLTELTRIQGDFTKLVDATSKGIKGVGETTAASGTAGQLAFNLALGVPPGPATVPSTPASVAASKTKAT